MHDRECPEPKSFENGTLYEDNGWHHHIPSTRYEN